jgi:hypothetical protein
MNRYRVTGTRAIAGHAPGSVFEAEFDAAKEARLLRAGVIAKARGNAKLREGNGDDDTNDDNDETGGE